MYTKTLVPLDGSPRSESVLPFAAAFASAFSTPVELFHVVETDVANLERIAKTKQSGSLEDELTTTANSYLQRKAQMIPESLPVKFTVKVGKVADMIVEEAAADKGALVTMATRGLSGAKRWLLGSVADKVLQAATNPLLLIKQPDEEEESAKQYDLKELLVPLDGSLLAETALPHAVAIAKSLGLKMTLFRAYEVPISVATPLPYAPNADRATLDAMREEVENYLREKVSQLTTQGIKQGSHIAALGEAGQQIVDAAGQGRQTLIVMCTHGRSGIGRWFLGSVATRVAHHSSSPVLVVRAAPPS